ncbi:MAG: hypothetical protein HGA45_27985 [Chloroflexales bacterium]|nr:hypothetical protein [Chloroflexales bacterium]
MTLQSALLAGLLPAVALALLGCGWLRSAAPPTARQVGLVLGALSLALGVVAGAALGASTTATWLQTLALPTLVSSLAATMLLLVRDRARLLLGSPWLLALLLADLAVLLVLAVVVDLAMPVFLVAGGTVLAAVWSLRPTRDARVLGLGLPVLVILGVALWLTEGGNTFGGAPTWLAGVGQILVILAPSLGITTAAWLLGAGLAAGTPWRRAAGALGLSAGLVLLVVAQILVGSIWDVATDGLRGSFTMIQACLIGIASGVFLAWSLSGHRAITALAFALLVPLAAFQAQQVGMRIAPTELTEQRSRTVTQAIQRYYADHQTYPATLDALTPRYLLIVPGPVIVPGQGWCYDGGKDYFRFGYVYRQYFSSPISARLHAAAGIPPLGVWPCAYQAEELRSYYRYPTSAPAEQ